MKVFGIKNNLCQPQCFSCWEPSGPLVGGGRASGAADTSKAKKTSRVLLDSRLLGAQTAPTARTQAREPGRDPRTSPSPTSNEFLQGKPLSIDLNRLSVFVRTEGRDCEPAGDAFLSCSGIIIFLLSSHILLRLNSRSKAVDVKGSSPG